MSVLCVGDLRAERGEKTSGYVQIHGADFGIPVTLICGAQEGKTVLISGGVHNAEYVGIQAAMELADELNPREVIGNIIIIRLMNRTGFERRTMSVVYEDGKNLNREFPGSAGGTLAERICYTVENMFLRQADYYIDLHCGDGFEGLVSYVYCQGAAAPEVVKKSREMAEIAHVDYLVESSLGRGGAYNYAGSMGIPGILLERGCSSLWCKDLVEEDKHDVRNILRYLGVLEGKPHRHGKPPIDVGEVIYEDAGHSGCWYPTRQPGETFRKGEILGKICDYFGNVLEICTAKKDGVILYETISLCIMRGTPMIAYGSWDEETMGKIVKQCAVCGNDHDAHHTHLHC
ncbi:MAG: M14 family metallopeptidase [Eubacteriales bacterium]|nr:M14 family metallopeptidase [Eubacteriales bacterium]